MNATPQTTSSAIAPPPMFPLMELLRDSVPSASSLSPGLRVVDVGAMLLSEAEDVWRPLVRAGICASVIGFEPHVEECKKLNEELVKRAPQAREEGCVYRYLPHAIGDGSTGTFRSCSAPMTSSMLEPNIPLLRRFMQLEEVTTVVQRTETKTVRLDDLLAELGGRADFLKLDVQGFELLVLKGATQVLRDCLVVHTEVEFVEMYEKQPLFAEVDQHLRGAGFVFHRFASIHGRPLKPIHYTANPLAPISQQLWADAVYVRDLWDLRDFSKDELLRTAFILHEVYHAYDVVHHVLDKYDAEVAKRYLARVLGQA